MEAGAGRAELDVDGLDGVAALLVLEGAGRADHPGAVAPHAVDLGLVGVAGEETQDAGLVAVQRVCCDVIGAYR